MKQSNKTKTATITLILTLTLAATFVALPTVSAHEPPWDVRTYAYIQAYPDPIGVGQTINVFGFLDINPPTAAGAWGDRWHGMTITVGKPDGSTQTLGPYTSDPVGTIFTLYTPDQVGTYQFQLDFPGQVLQNENPNPNGAWGDIWIGDYFMPSTSEKVSVTVQQDPIARTPSPPLPTDYWTRPIYATNYGWGQIAGNCLRFSGPETTATQIYYYTRAPESAHIVWTKPITFGGIVGGETGDKTYYTGSNYEHKFTPIIINGVIYYSVQSTRSTTEGDFVAVDLRTGEQLWHQNGTGNGEQIIKQLSGGGPGYGHWYGYPTLTYGQLYDYESPNQHGVVGPYLWSTGGGRWDMYDAFTGEWILSLEGVPGGTTVLGDDGSILIYNVMNNRLTVWNSSAAIPRAGPLGTDAWQWRPWGGATIDVSAPYEWTTAKGDTWTVNPYSLNVSIPEEVTGSIVGVLDDRIIISTPLTSSLYGYITPPYTVSALSLKPGEEGELLWSKDMSLPPGNLTLGWGPMSLEDGVFTIFSKETRQWWGYSLDTGEQLWGPTESETELHLYSGFAGMQRTGAIVYGKLFSGDTSAGGGGGMVYCYDVKTGELLWEFAGGSLGLNGYWPRAITMMSCIADNKVFLDGWEHSLGPEMWEGQKKYCVDAETGEALWDIDFFCGGESGVIADGYLVDLNTYDNQIYCFGKGQTETTVDAPLTAVPLESSVVIRGTVTDQSPGATGTPAIADEYMTEWMEYLYMQKPIPGDAKGVEVTLDAIDPNGNFIHIGRTATNMDGEYGLLWTPEIEGKYEIIATFEGSDSYWSSYDTTYIGVGPAPAAAVPIELEPTEAPLFTTTDLAIIAAVAVAVAIGIAAYWTLRKRK